MSGSVRKEWSHDRERKMRECLSCGLNICEIADMHGISRQRVAQIVGRVTKGNHGPQYYSNREMIKSLWEKGLNLSDMARATGLHKVTISTYLKALELGGMRYRVGRGPGESTIRMCELFDKGMSVNEIACLLNRNEDSVRTMLNKHGRTVAKRGRP